MDEADKRFTEFGARLESLKQEVDSLQIMLANVMKPWYRDGASLVSMLALIFSFGTTFVSYQKADQQDIHAAKSDLRILLQRLASLPKDNFELVTRYQNDANTAQYLSGYINQENSLLAKQAAEIAERIPANISSTEYFAIHAALRFASLDQLAVKFLEKAVEKADNANDAVAALRAYGTHLISTGQLDAGRAQYRKAESLFSVYLGHADYYQKTTQILTYLNWHGAEAGVGNMDEAERLLNLAKEIRVQLPPSQFTSQVSAQIDQVEANFQQMRGSRNPKVESPPKK